MRVTGPAPWLAALDRHQALFDLDGAAWADRIETALTAAVGPYRRIAVASKILHLKRPRLIPVLDSLVVQQIGGVNRTGNEIVDHLRRVGTQNRTALGVIAATLEKVHAERTPVRILDVLLWASPSVFQPLAEPRSLGAPPSPVCNVGLGPTPGTQPGSSSP